MSKKVDKYIEFFTTKFSLFYKEKKKNFPKHTVKFILEKENSSSDLVVVFSGIPRQGLKARYNYMRTLKDIKSNKLFILDDLGYDQRGAYYLGKNKDFFMVNYVKSLISDVKTELNIKNTIYAGSSKGGWAALYFGIQDNGSSIVAGSAHYRLGDYLTSSQTYKTNQMAYLMGNNYTDEDVDYLNKLLEKTIDNNQDNNVDIYYHYSDNEKMYKVYTIDLLSKISAPPPIEIDLHHYKTHAEIAYHFPDFLSRSIKKIIN